MITLQQLTNVKERRAGEQETALEHLTSCHRRIEQRLEIFERAGEHLSGRRQEALEAINNAFKFFDTTANLHTIDEEQSLFPRLRGHLGPEELAFVESLESDHQHADKLLAELKSIAAQLGASSQDSSLIERYRRVATELCQAYRKHIATEDESLIRLSEKKLSPEELADIRKEMTARRGR